MKMLLASLAAIVSTLLPIGASFCLTASDKAPLHLLNKIRMPGIEGDFDHFSVDVKGNRLFLAAEEHHTIEVFDLHSGKMVHSITGFDTPHSIVYVPTVNRLFVIDGGKGGSCQVLDATTYKVRKSIKLSDDADAVICGSTNILF